MAAARVLSRVCSTSADEALLLLAVRDQSVLDFLDGEQHDLFILRGRLARRRRTSQPGPGAGEIEARPGQRRGNGPGTGVGSLSEDMQIRANVSESVERLRPSATLLATDDRPGNRTLSGQPGWCA